jgi:hypothetical protein
VLDRRGVALFDALWTFFHEYQYCGELDNGKLAGRSITRA